MMLFNLNLTPQMAIILFFVGPILGLIVLIVGLASVGASFGLRRMYVKALLKLFEVSLSF